jgi:hypothetical protein
MSSGIADLYAPKIMCCICFGAFDKDQLFVDDAGETWDVCKDCAPSIYDEEN